MTARGAVVERFGATFRETVGHRRIGREAEFPVVGPQGHAADVTLLVQRLLDEEGFEAVTADGALTGALTCGFAVMLEAGTGTVEVVFDPVDDLVAADRQYRHAVRVLDEIADGLGFRVLDRGLQPLTPAGDDLMTDKARYHVMRERLGAPWLWFTVTAGDQTHVDVGRDEAAAVFSVTNRLVPAVLALCGNSAGVDPQTQTVVPNLREQRMYALQHRHGFGGRYGQLPDGIDSLAGYVEHLGNQPLVSLSADLGFAEFAGSFNSWADEPGRSVEQVWHEYAFHEHYTWPSCRLRSRTGTIELRAACQQPRHEHLAAATVNLGIVEGWSDLASVRVPDGMLGRAMERGLDLPPADLAVVEAVLSVCEERLRSRGRGEEAFVAPLRERLRTRRNPGQRDAATIERETTAGVRPRTHRTAHENPTVLRSSHAG